MGTYWPDVKLSLDFLVCEFASNYGHYNCKRKSYNYSLHDNLSGQASNNFKSKIGWLWLSCLNSLNLWLEFNCTQNRFTALFIRFIETVVINFSWWSFPAWLPKLLKFFLQKEINWQGNKKAVFISNNFVYVI